MVEVPLRVLIVDDQPDAARTLAVLVRKWGHQAEVAYNGEEALNRAALFRPHVVLLDIMLPGMDGPSIARALHEMPTQTEVVVIAVSGYPDETKRAFFGKPLFDDYFLKPVEPGVLEQVLRAERVRLARSGRLVPGPP